MTLKGKSLISIRDINKREAEFIIDRALDFDTGGKRASFDFLANKQFSVLFFENSTRTRNSFEASLERLGAKYRGFAGAEGTSVKKGEPLLDTIEMFLGYGYDDGIIMRHPLEGSARFVSENVSCPVISGGDGAHEHPTQALLDYATIKKLQGSLDGVKIGRVGDLKNGRTVHSGLILDSYFDAKVWLASPKSLLMPNWVLDIYKKNTGKIPTQRDTIEEIIEFLNILYDSRIQKERFADENDYEKVKNEFIVKLKTFERARSDLKLLHPLPRCKWALEIDYDVDATKFAYFRQQAAMGLPTRMSIEECIFGSIAEGVDFGETTSFKKSRPLISDLEIKIDPQEEERAKHYILQRITKGTVIDHLRPGTGFKALVRLGIYDFNGNKNPEYHGHDIGFIDDKKTSKGPLEKKDIVKINNVYLDERQLTRLAIEFPEAVVSYIDDKKVIKKFRLNIPDLVEEQINCPNVRCITRPEHNEGAKSKFYYEGNNDFQCHYCDTQVGIDDLELL